MSHTDIASSALILRLSPPRLRPYLLLARLDRPVGIWLLLLPGWWALALAGETGAWPWIAFLLGSVIMRAAGCVVNDLLDRDLDRQVARTAGRPLASGAVGPRAALGFLALLLSLGLAILLTFTPFAWFIGAASLVLVGLYPLMKRITWWPQAFLGVTFSWGALLGTAAAKGTIDPPALLLYGAAILVTIGYDTIYAHQDIEDDARVGVKSTARLFGGAGRAWVAGFFAAGWLMLAALPLLAPLSAWFWPGMAAGAAVLAVQVGRWKMFDPADSLHRFKLARWFEAAVLAALLMGVFL